MMFKFAPRRLPPSLRLGATLCAALALLAACSKETPPAARPAIDVTAMTVTPRDIPVAPVYIAQTQSSQGVNVQARVNGWLDKRVYTEGSIVKAGQVLFQMDPKPFQAQVDAAQAALERQQAALGVAKANLDRTTPLTAQNALSQKDLDDATGQFQQAQAAVEQAKAQLETAKLNLSYTTILSPVDGITSYAVVADGTYLDAQHAQLTTVSVLSPMWINFSISENEWQRIHDDIRKGLLRFPEGSNFTAEIELVDGSIFPQKGKITFANPSYDSTTGTFLIRATVLNPQGILRPNQYVRTRLIGAVRPNAIMVPQRAVQQSAKGHFVWLVGKDGKAELRPITVGSWYNQNWFISEGLAGGDQVIVDGVQRLTQGAELKVTPYVPKPETLETAPAARPPGASMVVYFAAGSAKLDDDALRILRGSAPGMLAGASLIDITGYADRTGNPASNADLAKQRAAAVRSELIAEGIPPARIRLKAPQYVTGPGSDQEARRVELTAGQ